MTGRHFVAGLMVAGLMATGCGGTEVEEVPTDEAMSRQEAALDYPCDGTLLWSYTYYGDVYKTQKVGQSRCDCKGVMHESGTQTTIRRLSITSCSNAPD
ncbi:hypothetical protein [Melittangium boletus]|uniref:hypothetical protein n=1 Tax=Melittangium boletus TaxID=83453 RepID=UPI003DA1E8DB